MQRAIVLIHTKDKKGIIAKVTGWFYNRAINILHSQQCTIADDETMFFMRIELEIDEENFDKLSFEKDFKKFAKSEGFFYQLFYKGNKERIAILVSKTSHCLYEILSRCEEGDLDADIVFVAGNHEDLRSVSDKFGIPFHYFPIINKDKATQEKKIIQLLNKEKIDTVVLARYMQILSPDFISAYRNKIINIHHGFLPAFQGANPYLQAYERGVKIIGATAHFASENLDQGPIIEQDVIRVNHEQGPSLLREMGKDVEKRTLFAALLAQVEHRIIVYKNRTVVFAKES